MDSACSASFDFLRINIFVSLQQRVGVVFFFVVMMARLRAVFFFIGVVAFFAIATLGLACVGRSIEPHQTVPATRNNLVVTGEDLSGRGEGPHLDGDDWAGFGSPVKRFWRQQLKSLLPPRTSEEIQESWPCTFRLHCSVLGQPLGPVTPSRSSWRGYLRPMKQDNRTCAIMACTMAVEGMHRKVYETFHGPNKFPDAWKAAEGWAGQLLRTCESQGIWTEGEGAVVSHVLTKIQVDLRGVRTASGQGQQLVMTLDKYKKHSGDELTTERVAELLDQGPCVGRLWACPWYSCFDATKNDNWVYRGCGRDQVTRDACKSRYPDENAKMGSHAVVCFAYRHCQDGEMHVRVLDNHTDGGPERWVDVQELDAIYSLKVDCLCGSAEHHHDAGASAGTVT